MLGSNSLVNAVCSLSLVPLWEGTVSAAGVAEHHSWAKCSGAAQRTEPSRAQLMRPQVPVASGASAVSGFETYLVQAVNQSS